MSEKISAVTATTTLADADLFALAKFTGVGPTGFASRHITAANLLSEVAGDTTFITNLTTNNDFIDGTVTGVVNNITTTDITEGTNQYFTQARLRTEVEEETGATYTLVLADADHKWKKLTHTAALTLTVPPAASVAWPANTYIELEQGGAGQVAIAEGAGVTVRVNANLTRYLNGQYAVAALKYEGNDVWVAFGNLEPA